MNDSSDVEPPVWHCRCALIPAPGKHWIDVPKEEAEKLKALWLHKWPAVKVPPPPFSCSDFEVKPK